MRITASLRSISLLGILFVCLALALPAANAGKQLPPPKKLTATYSEERDVVNIKWKRVKKAKQYRVQVIDDVSQKKIAATKTKKRTITIAGAKFYYNATYTIRVRVLGKKSNKKSKWASTTYTHPVRSTPPTFKEVLGSTPVNGASKWMFIVDDQQTELAGSAERDGSVIMGRIAPQGSTGIDATAWTAVITATDMGSAISDHWHMYAHDAHWIVASNSTTNKSVLAKIASDFTVEKMVTVVDGGETPTNDMFLVEEPDGVTVGHFLPKTGHRLFRYDTDLTLVNTLDIGGGEYVHANGASALRTENGFVVLAPTSMQPFVEGSIKLMQYDAAWQAQSMITLIAESGSNIAMASGAYTGGYLIVHARVIENATSRASSNDSSGAIVRYVFDSNNKQLDRTVLLSSNGQRPHATISDTDLVTSWDIGTSAALRVDRME